MWSGIILKLGCDELQICIVNPRVAFSKLLANRPNLAHNLFWQVNIGTQPQSFIYTMSMAILCYNSRMSSVSRDQVAHKACNIYLLFDTLQEKKSLS